VEGLEAEKITGVCNHPVLFACKILGGLVTFALRNRDHAGTKGVQRRRCAAWRRKTCDDSTEKRLR
jgi:hypothetical protein